MYISWLYNYADQFDFMRRTYLQWWKPSLSQQNHPKMFGRLLIEIVIIRLKFVRTNREIHASLDQFKVGKSGHQFETMLYIRIILYHIDYLFI